VFSFNVGMLLVRADSRQFTHGLLHWQQHVLKLTLLTEDEVKFLIESRLVDFHTFYIRVQLSDLCTQTETHIIQTTRELKTVRGHMMPPPLHVHMDLPALQMQRAIRTMKSVK